MSPHKTDWIDWWDSEDIVSPVTWSRNMHFFVTASDSLLHYNSQDIILDIGSGPGSLAEHLKGRVKEIHCLDTSQRYLDICKEKFARDSNIFIHKLHKDNYADLSFLDGKRYSKTICNSVIQYYKDIGEVEKLIREVQRVSSPGARFLIADIPASSNPTINAFVLLKGSIRSKRSLEISGMLLRKFTNAKYWAAYTSGFLTFTDEMLRGMIGRLNLDAEVLGSNLTVNANRRHLLIKF